MLLALRSLLWQVVTGTSVTAQSKQTEAASALLIFTGTAITAQQRQTALAAASLIFTGTATISQQRQTAAGTAKEVFTGTAAVAQAAQRVSATATEVFTGSAATSQRQSVAAAVSLIFTAAGTIAQAVQRVSGLAFTGVTFTGIGAQTQLSQSVSGTADQVAAPIQSGSGLHGGGKSSRKPRSSKTILTSEEPLPVLIAADGVTRQKRQTTEIEAWRQEVMTGQMRLRQLPQIIAAEADHWDTELEEVLEAILMEA